MFDNLIVVKELNKKIEEYNNFKNNNLKYSIINELNNIYSDRNKKIIKLISLEIDSFLGKENCDADAKIIFGDLSKKIILESLIAESIFCLKEVIRLAKTIGETHMFSHGFMGSMHDRLSFWVKRYETYKQDFCEKSKKNSIDKYLQNYFGKDWEEHISGYYENKQALSHYIKSIETHHQGRAYHDMIDKMCYIKDDYNDRSDHFNIADERHCMWNKEDNINNKIKNMKKEHKDSELHKIDNYFHKKE